MLKPQFLTASRHFAQETDSKEARGKECKNKMRV